MILKFANVNSFVKAFSRSGYFDIVVYPALVDIKKNTTYPFSVTMEDDKGAKAQPYSYETTVDIKIYRPPPLVAKSDVNVTEEREDIVNKTVPIKQVVVNRVVARKNTTNNFTEDDKEKKEDIELPVFPEAA